MLDDDGRRELPGVDVLLNQNLHAAASLYPEAENGQRLLLGVEHILLRREFLLAGAAGGRNASGPVRNVLITLGGGDPNNLTGEILAAVAQEAAPGLQVTVLVGGANPHLEALRRMAVRYPELNIEILQNVQDMPARYGAADLALTAGGGTLWELAFTGVPALTVIVAENQVRSSLLLAEAGATRCLGRAEDLSRAAIARSFARLCGDGEQRRVMSQAGRGLVDGRGSQRVLACLGTFPAKSEPRKRART